MCKAMWPALLIALAQGAALAQDARLSIGEPIDAQAAQAVGVSALPDGEGLPSGRGTAKEGQRLYAAQCAACHGERGEGTPGFHALVGGRGTLGGDKPVLTVGSYWPYATTIFDYIWRAMPYQAPGSLTADDAYALTAWLLHANGLIGEDAVIDRKSLPAIVMPNRDGFIGDPRPDIPPGLTHERR